MLRVLLLGSAAGGGVPQWNCDCSRCRSARDHEPGTLRSGQASIAVSADGENWFLINASPDLRQQVIDNPALRPRHGPRDSPIAGVVLTNGDVDAIAGLLTMREGSPFTIYAHARVLDVLRENSIFNVLAPGIVKREEIAINRAFEPKLPDGRRSGLEIEAFAVPGKIALYLEDKGEAGAYQRSDSGDTLGLHIKARGIDSGFFYLAACAQMPPELADRVRGAPLVFFDGTLWADDEMIRGGLSAKTGARMGHMSMAGEQGSLAAFRSLGVQRKIFLHINNSNPALVASSSERAELERCGWEILQDGSEIVI